VSASSQEAGLRERTPLLLQDNTEQILSGCAEGCDSPCVCVSVCEKGKVWRVCALVCERDRERVWYVCVE
jgi:hypothetical protein